MCNQEPVAKIGNICRDCLEGGQKIEKARQLVETPDEKNRDGFSRQLMDLLYRYPEVMEVLKEQAHDQIRTVAEQLVWELREATRKEKCS